MSTSVLSGLLGAVKGADFTGWGAHAISGAGADWAAGGAQTALSRMKAAQLFRDVMGSSVSGQVIDRFAGFVFRPV